MSEWRDGKWTKGNRTIEGKWRYIWASNCFSIVLNSKDRITGETRKTVSFDEQPNFNGWKLVKEEK
jgi:hypothetical protein